MLSLVSLSDESISLKLFSDSFSLIRFLPVSSMPFETRTRIPFAPMGDSPLIFRSTSSLLKKPSVRLLSLTSPALTLTCAETTPAVRMAKTSALSVRAGNRAVELLVDHQSAPESG
jgi:hypothetical protein